MCETDEIQRNLFFYQHKNINFYVDFLPKNSQQIVLCQWSNGFFFLCKHYFDCFIFKKNTEKGGGKFDVQTETKIMYLCISQKVGTQKTQKK